MADGFVLWEGETQIPGESGRVAAIVTGVRNGSRNAKTGAMAQVWYIPIDEGVLVGDNGAIAQGRDRSVCGSCKHRPSDGGICYVGSWALHAIQQCYERGGYPRLSPSDAAEVLRNRAIRFGAWGDPACIPLEVYAPLRATIGPHQGYTHVWPFLASADWGWLMASVDNSDETESARRRGWRRFRVIVAGETMTPDEKPCPASAEMGMATTCARCRSCGGNTGKGRKGPSRVIVAHGSRAARFIKRARQLRLFGG